MMEFVNGKDDIPFILWNIKFIFETNQASHITVYLQTMCMNVFTPWASMGRNPGAPLFTSKSLLFGWMFIPAR
jgi:hypothetical protein